MTIQAIWKSHSGSYSQVSDTVKVQSMRINSTYIKARGKPGDNKPGKKYNRQLFMTHLNLLEKQTSSPISSKQPFHLLCDMLFSRTALWETTIIKPFVRTNKTDNMFTPGRAELQGWARNHRAVYLAFGKERPSQALLNVSETCFFSEQQFARHCGVSLLSTLSQEPLCTQWCPAMAFRLPHLLQLCSPQNSHFIH